ncbi:MAG: DEAD/DEAH box helicase family protein [Anaerolineaceae bacterium]
MTEKIEIQHYNEVYVRVKADMSILQELTEFFMFRPAGFQFTPKFKAKIWDGYIRLISPHKPIIYKGLIGHLKKFCEDRDYEIVIEDGLFPTEEVPDDYGFDFAKEINATLEPRDYQNQYFVTALREGRTLSLSPTSSGKSFIIHLIVQYYWRVMGLRTLIIVPTTGLVDQMVGDFKSYGADPDMLYKIRGGIDKETDLPVVVSTWQSLYKMPSEYFDRFGVVIGDEAHLFSAKSLVGILEKMEHARFRFGFTGTISSESKTHQLVLQGLFGPLVRYVKTKDLIESGTVADFKVKAIVLKYPQSIVDGFKAGLSKVKKEKRYHTEREFLVSNTRRNTFIRNLVWSLKDQNNLILFDLVEKHGKVLKELFETEGRILHFMTGASSVEERESVRHTVEDDPLKRHDILASYQLFSTGVNIKRLDNVIFASGSQSEIRVLQSIGRTLRKGNGSDNATLYDIGDDLSKGSYTNYTMKHMEKRLEIYASEGFPFKIFKVDL